MRAVRITEWTTPDRLRVCEVGTPACRGRELLIRVHAAAVSRSLALLIQGRYQRRPSLPFVPGNTVAGTVIETGPDAIRFRPGARVVAALEHGGLAEFAVAPEASTYAIPDGLPFAEATALNSAYNSVAAALTWPGILEVRPAQTLLVTGASGCVGTAAVQIGRLLGARVIAATRGGVRRDHALANGADAILDSDPGTLREAVRRITDGRGVDAALESVGGAVFDAALRAVAPGGRIVPLGFAGGEIPSIPANLLLVKNVTVCGLYMGYYKVDARERYEERMRALFATLAAWWEDGSIRPLVRACLPLERAAEAFALQLEGTTPGHVVVVAQDGDAT